MSKPKQYITTIDAVNNAYGSTSEPVCAIGLRQAPEWGQNMVGANIGWVLSCGSRYCINHGHTMGMVSEWSQGDNIAVIECF